MARPFCVYNRCFSSQSRREYHIIVAIDKFAMDAKCSLSELRKSKCGDFRGSPFAVRKLLECKDDITGHLQSCHLSKLVGGGGGGLATHLNLTVTCIPRVGILII